MTFEEFVAYYNENKDDAEVAKFVNSAALTKENVSAYLDGEEGKQILQPRLDKYHSKSLESWKENNLDKLVEEELAKRNPEKSEAELQVEQLRREIEEERAKNRRQELLGNTTKQLADEGLPTKLVELLIAEDEEKLNSNVETYRDLVKSVKESAIEEFAKQHGRDYKPGGQNPPENKAKELVASIYGEGNATDQTTKAQEAYFKTKE